MTNHKKEKNVMNKLFVWTLLISGLCLGLGNAFAEDSSNDSSQIYTLGEVVVTAPDGRGVETVGTLHQITDKEIEIRQIRTLDKALELLPGLDIRYGAQGIPRVNMRGLRSRHVILLLNGIPFNSTYDGQFDPSTIPVENIAKIKVSYGNHSVLYGQGGMGGVINIITKKGTQGFHGNLAADIDERGNTTARADVYGGKEKMNFFASGSLIDSDGFLLSDDFTATSQEDGGIRENSDIERQNIFVNLGFEASDALSFGLFAGNNQGEYGKPPSVVDDSSDPFYKTTKYERTDDYQAQFVQGSLSYHPRGIFGLRAWGYANTNEEDNAGYDDETYTAITKKNSYSTTDKTKIAGGTIQGFFNFEGMGRLALSANSEKNKYDSNGYDIDKNNNRQTINISSDISLYSLAAEYDITLGDDLSLVAGYSHHWQDKDVGENDDKGSYLLGLSYDIYENTRLRTSYARKIRFASIRNLYDPDSGNSDLTTEQSDNYEAGITQHLPWNITADLAFFLSDVEDYIEKDSVTDLFENNDEYRFKGVELTLSKTFERADINLGYSYLDAEDRSAGSTVDELEYRPTHKITIEGRYAFEFGLTAYASFMRIMNQVHYASDGTKGDLNDYSIVDIKLEQRLFKQWFVYAGADNILDENYEESYGYPQAGRTAYAGMKVAF